MKSFFLLKKKYVGILLFCLSFSPLFSQMGPPPFGFCEVVTRVAASMVEECNDGRAVVSINAKNRNNTLSGSFRLRSGSDSYKGIILFGFSGDIATSPEFDLDIKSMVGKPGIDYKSAVLFGYVTKRNNEVFEEGEGPIAMFYVLQDDSDDGPGDYIDVYLDFPSDGEPIPTANLTFNVDHVEGDCTVARSQVSILSVANLPPYDLLDPCKMSMIKCN